MTALISKYIDLFAMALTVLLPILFTIRLKKAIGRRLRAVPLYLLIFGPTGILVFIFCHLFENIFRAIIAAMEGTFQYNFHFYSLILLGVVVGYIGVKLFGACRQLCLREERINKPYFTWSLLMLLFTVPLIPIIPIAAVPLICCFISFTGFAFFRRSSRQLSPVKQETDFALTV